MLTPERIRTLYRQGKRTFIHDGDKYNITRGGPDNNYLTVSPVDDRKFVPVQNLAYDTDKERKRSEAKRHDPDSFKHARRSGKR